MPPNVLIVDDESSLNELFVIGLSKYGFETEGVLGGRECLELLNNHYRPDLILLDVMMEPMDGWETLTRLKQIDEVKNIPVIMQTGKNLTYKEAERFSSCIEDYLMKPITPKRCVPYITNTLEKVRAIEKTISKALRAGYPEEKIFQLAQLYRTIDVAKKLLVILEERYESRNPSGDNESYGPAEYADYLLRLQQEFDDLQKEINFTLGSLKPLSNI
ncbi:MAG TPA: response regulator [Methanospirillum sp.]|jgi:CheY-like chemotaxis protein|uniref:response regulator n=1 Tax=Methanospirillum sp. TaxID=45200 RepID=UPI0009D61850|nr:response regulator [Methanospirillum sp.]NLL10247.1 response regulator [Methanomicrobiales archaeon]OQB35998.1 MAG: response regulator PleD [Euryarchaeota archaeon ADurb.Bin165]HPY59714.1 response regulator [Methanospirillum sp.]